MPSSLSPWARAMHRAGMRSGARSTGSRCFAALMLGQSGAALGCPNCPTSRNVWSTIAAHQPGSTLALLLLAFATVAVLIIATALWMRQGRRLLGGSLLLGAGLGALFDGILLHQILQWHAMISSDLPPADLIASKANMFWDGIFHAFSWLTTVVGVSLVIREVPLAAPALRGRAVLGGALAGWGWFNLVEGWLDHQVFAVHHVHPGTHELIWDMGFLGLGLILLGVGFAIAVPVLRPTTAP